MRIHRTVPLLAVALLVTLGGQTPAQADHDPDVGNRTRHVAAHPCWADMRITESPGEQTLTGPGGPNLRDVDRITASITNAKCSIPSPCCGADYVTWEASFNGKACGSGTQLTYPVRTWPGSPSSCSFNEPTTGTYTLTLQATIHPFLDPVEPGQVRTG